MKTIIFDFDGTITQKGANVWKKLWSNAGFSIGKDSLFAKLYVEFLNGNLSHQAWCDKTCNVLRAGGLTQSDVQKVANALELKDGVKETLELLKSDGFSLHILSGGVKEVIEKVLGDNAKYFDSINANVFEYDENSRISHIEETKYDFEGKLDFVEKMKREQNISEKDIIFVGNGDNDEWVKKSGCNTICITPDLTDHNDKSKWDFGIENLTDLRQILPIVEDIIEENNMI